MHAAQKDDTTTPLCANQFLKIFEWLLEENQMLREHVLPQENYVRETPDTDSEPSVSASR